MSDTSQGEGWWKASDGKWYPPKNAAPGPGWWLASDGNWYPPTAKTGGTEKPAAKAVSPTSKEPPTKKPPTKKPPVKPTAKTPTAAKAATKPAAKPATKPAAKPAVKSAAKPAAKPKSTKAPASTGKSGARQLPPSRRVSAPANPNEGMSPEEQIERRNAASRADAAAVASQRFAAASRILGSLKDEAKFDQPTKAERLTAATATPSTGPVKTTAAAPAPAPAPKPKAAKPTTVAPEPSTPPASAILAAAAAERGPEPLLEVKGSALSTDLDHLGERLAIFTDRVELRDRHDHVRQSVTGDEIIDVIVHRRLTGVVLSIEGVDGPIIVAKGLRLEQAEEARLLILKKTRPTGPVDRSARDRVSATPRDEPAPPRPTEAAPRNEPAQPRPAAEPAAASTKASRPAVNEADLLRKLGDLHRAGILTAEEYQEKIELVGRLVRGEDLTVTAT